MGRRWDGRSPNDHGWLRLLVRGVRGWSRSLERYGIHAVERNNCLFYMLEPQLMSEGYFGEGSVDPKRRGPCVRRKHRYST